MIYGVQNEKAEYVEAGWSVGAMAHNRGQKKDCMTNFFPHLIEDK